MLKPLLLLAGLLGLCSALSAPAWDETGHGVVGILALEQVSEPVRAELAGLLDSMEPQRIASACNWPDRIREAGMADWSKPLHYVNPDPLAEGYVRARDCANGDCVPEAVLRYAQQLGDESLEPWQRKEAFAFLCHFTGDLHQPLHVAYADDKGGNLVTVNYNGHDVDLHHLWDRELIETHVGSADELVAMLRVRPNATEPPWTPAQVVSWTNESLTFTRHSAYPAQRTIDPAFADHSWQIIQQRLDAAAARLATILEAVL
jgi:hypothetical protein